MVADSLSQLQAVAARNAGSEAWSEGGVEGLRCHVRVDTTAGSAEQHVAAVLAALQGAGVLEGGEESEGGVAAAPISI